MSGTGYAAKKELWGNRLGQQLHITATDPGFAKDVVAWCKITGANLLSVENKAGVIHATIEKTESQNQNKMISNGDNKTFHRVQR